MPSNSGRALRPCHFPAIRAAHRARSLDHHPIGGQAGADHKADSVFDSSAILANGLFFGLHLIDFAFTHLIPPWGSAPKLFQ